MGVHDDLIDLGLDSILAIQIAARARQSGLELSPAELFQHTTIAELAEHAGTISLAAEPSLVAVSPELRDGACEAGALAVATQDMRPTVRRRETPEPPPAAPLPSTQHTIIESFGVYLPPKVVSTAEVVRSCRLPLDFPLERMTGIRSRRMAGETEFAIDLAEKAVIDCLARSAYKPSDIDLLLCCNISRCDGPGNRFTYEPTSAARLQRRFGFDHAIAFDISNACAGTFTAIALADAFLKTGAAKRAMVVSGEYITHLTRTAQKEITDFMDPRIACLTLGDSGAAIVLERSRAEGVGFQELDLYTLGKFSDLCVAKATDRPHGGAIMLTDSIQGAAVTIQQAVGHSLRNPESPRLDGGFARSDHHASDLRDDPRRGRGTDQSAVRTARLRPWQYHVRPGRAGQHGNQQSLRGVARRDHGRSDQAWVARALRHQRLGPDCGHGALYL